MKRDPISKFDKCAITITKQLENIYLIIEKLSNNQPKIAKKRKKKLKKSK